MNRKLDFDIFDNTDDRIAEKLISDSVLSDEEKERIFMMSRKKLKKRMRKNQNDTSARYAAADNREEFGTENKRKSNISYTQDNEQLRKIKISRFTTIASAAACLIVVCGVTGMLHSLNGADDDTDSVHAPAVSMTSAVSDDSPDVISSEPESSSAENDSYEDPKKNEDSKADDTAPKKTVTTASTAEPINVNVGADESKPDNGNDSQTDMSQYIDIANGLINDMDTLYLLSIGGGVSYDLSQETYSVTNPESPYCNEFGVLEYNLVNDPKFKSTADINEFISSTVTDDFKAHSIFNDILDPGSSKFVDNNGNLYGLYSLSSRAGGGGYSGFTATTITDVTDSSFTAVLTEDTEGGAKIVLKVVNENGIWKVDEQY